MNIAIRLFAVFFLIVGLAAWFVLNIFSQEIAPGIRQATEESLVDSANMLAELAAPELAQGTITEGRFATALQSARERTPKARIFEIDKLSIDSRVYVTDTRGIVQFDTEPHTLGQDYSQWRDVARVLRGEYGARSSRSDPYDANSSVMYVAAPVLHKGKLIGTLTVAKPSASIRPYIQRAEERVRNAGLILIICASAIGIAFTLWLNHSIEGLRRYAKDVADGKTVVAPTRGGSQFAELARTLAWMRERLDGKQYVETYVQNLAHEMKSPLTAITGAAELLQENLPEHERIQFAHNVSLQSQRLREIIDRMLQLAHLEKLQTPTAPTILRVVDLLNVTVTERQLALQARQLDCQITTSPDLYISGDQLLLQQALLNLLDNAIDFAPSASCVEIKAVSRENGVEISVLDHGPGAPDYALPKLFDRFYSLPHPATGEKSTGLGLALVREVARLHGGSASFRNHPEGGGVGSIELPSA